MQADVAVILKGLLDSFGAEYKDISQVEVAGQTIYQIAVDDGKQLIGSHGDTVHAIDYLVKKMVEQQSSATEGGEAPHFIIDVNDYRTRQIRDLQTKAKMMAERARSFQYDVEMSPMSAYERLIIHTTLQDEPNIKTESMGEGRGRRVVIKYAAG